MNRNNDADVRNKNDFLDNDVEEIDHQYQLRSKQWNLPCSQTLNQYEQNFC